MTWPGMPPRSCLFSWNFSDRSIRNRKLRYRRLHPADRDIACRRAGGFMAKNSIKISAKVVDTIPATIAGADKHPGWHALRTIAARITTPLLPDDYLQLANPLWSARELRGRILDVRRETEDSATLVIKPGWGFTFDYEPGQYVGIGVLMDGRWRWRSYSLTSSPVKGARTITITIKAMPEGFLSSHLVGGAAPGTIVRLAVP